MRLKNNHLWSVFAISLIFTAGFITGCGDEGDSATDMISGDGDMMNGEVVDPTTELPENGEEVIDPVTTVSYKDDIEPILNESCALANCHVTNGAGGLDLSSYDAFKAGGNKGDAFVVNDGEGSLVVQLIENGSMPLGGTPLTGEQIQLFIDWIDEGAENN